MRTRRDIIKPSGITFGCFGLLVGAIMLYLYFLNMSVVQVVLRTEFIQEQHNLNAKIAMLEASYIQSQHLVAAKIGGLEGYNQEAAKIFVSRKQPSLVLNVN